MRNSDGIEGKPREAYQAIAFSENRCPPRIKCGAGFFGIMLYPLSNVSPRTQLMIPGAEHNAGRSGEHAEYGERKRFDFFVRHLLGQNPPEWSIELRTYTSA